MNHTDSLNILAEFQYGFQANHSCKTQLLNTVEDLSWRLWQKEDYWHAESVKFLNFRTSEKFDVIPLNLNEKVIP